MVRKSWFGPMILVLAFALLYSTIAPSAHAQESAITEFKLPNGLTVILQESHESKTVAFFMSVPGGIRAEGSETGKGLSHFTEHLLANGYVKWGERAGASVNAFTSPDSVGYFLQISSDRLEEAMRVFAESLGVRDFPDILFENEKIAVLNEVAGRVGDTSTRVSDLLRQELFRVHPYGWPVGGDPALVSSVTKEDVERYLRIRYVPAHMILVVVGDFETAAFIPKVRKQFESLPAGPYAPITVPAEPEPLSGQRYFEKIQEHVAYFAVGYQGVSFMNPDAPALNVLSDILSSGLSARLYQQFVATGKALNLWSYSSTPTDPGFFSLGGSLRPEELTDVLEKLDQTIADIATVGVRNDELERVKAQHTVSFSRKDEDTLNTAIRLAQYRIFFGTARSAATHFERYQAVTAEDIRRVAGKYLKKERQMTVILSPLVPDGHAVQAAPLKIERAFSRETSANGAVLITRRDPTRTYSVVNVMIDYGLNRYDISPALRKLLPAMMENGTRSHSRSEIANLMETPGGGLQISGSLDALSFQLLLPVTFQAEGLELLREIIEEPRLDPADLAVEKRRLESALAAAEDSPWDELLMRLRSAFLPSPQGTRLTRSDIQAVDDATLSIMLHDLFCASRVTVVASGSFDPMVIRGFAGTLLSGRVCKQAAARPVLPAAQSGLHRDEFSMQKPTSTVMHAFRGPNVWKTPKDRDRALLAVAAHILSLRVEDAARAKAGISYAQHVHSSAYRADPARPADGSLVIGFIEVKRLDDVPVAEQILVTEFQKLRNVPVSSQECADAISAVRTQFELAMVSTENTVSHVSGSELMGGSGERAAENFREIFENITPADLQKFAETYFVPERGALLIQRGTTSEQ